MTLKDAYDLFEQEDSRLKHRWMRESKIMEKVSRVDDQTLEKDFMEE